MYLIVKNAARASRKLGRRDAGRNLERKLRWQTVGLIKRTAMFYDFLFPQYLRGRAVSIILLLIRLFFGALFFMHGLDKMWNFNELSFTFPSVLGFGPYVTLMIAIFCEFACSLFLMSGLLTRLILLPMILAMAVAFFDVNDALMPQGELSLIYLIVFVGLFLCGPGKYSVDYLIDRRLQKEKKVGKDEAGHERSKD